MWVGERPAGAESGEIWVTGAGVERDADTDETRRDLGVDLEVAKALLMMPVGVVAGLTVTLRGVLHFLESPKEGSMFSISTSAS